MVVKNLIKIQQLLFTSKLAETNEAKLAMSVDCRLSVSDYKLIIL